MELYDIQHSYTGSNSDAFHNKIFLRYTNISALYLKTVSFFKKNKKIWFWKSLSMYARLMTNFENIQVHPGWRKFWNSMHLNVRRMTDFYTGWPKKNYT